MGRVESLEASYASHVAVPWDSTTPPAQRVWFAVYPMEEERRLRLRLDTFEVATQREGKDWDHVDVTDAFADWMSGHEYADAYFSEPEDLTLPHPGFEEQVSELVRAKLKDANENTVVAVTGVASLYGLMRVSVLIDRVEEDIEGRLLVFFPGDYEDNNYRLLNARDGWNYHAVPITPTQGGYSV